MERKLGPDVYFLPENSLQEKGRTAQGICEDYRASATLDLEHDRLDISVGQHLSQPLHVLWGQHGAVGQNFDVLRLWRERAVQVTGHGLPCGHYIAEEAPELLLAQALAFFTLSIPA